MRLLHVECFLTQRKDSRGSCVLRCFCTESVNAADVFRCWVSFTTLRSYLQTSALLAGDVNLTTEERKHFCQEILTFASKSGDQCKYFKEHTTLNKHSLSAACSMECFQARVRSLFLMMSQICHSGFRSFILCSLSIIVSYQHTSWCIIINYSFPSCKPGLHLDNLTYLEAKYLDIDTVWLRFHSSLKFKG